MRIDKVSIRPEACTIDVAHIRGVPSEVDQIAAQLDTRYQFLRAHWFAFSETHEASTLLAKRRDGALLAAIPAVSIGPSLLGVRSVPGSYWPFRSALIAPDTSADELADMLSHPTTVETLGPLWRMGPVYSDNPAVRILKNGAARAGWTVLVRRLGTSFLFDMTSDWPRKSTRRRLNNYLTQLSQLGPVRFEHVEGDQWSADTLETLATIERASWIGRDTDGSGAKFMAATRRQEWLHVLADPVLAKRLSATILYVGTRPIAFSFDLASGSLQYSIACNYDAEYAHYRPGKVVTAHQIEIARAQSITTIDLGAGDSGYKRQMGATPGPEILDLLMVRSRSAAALVKMRWGTESTIARDAYYSAKAEQRLIEPGDQTTLELVLALGAVAAATLAIVE